MQSAISKKFKQGDRISFRWFNIDPTKEFTTFGYILKTTKRGLMIFFPRHKKAKKIRWFNWFIFDSTIYDGREARLQKDIIGSIKKIMEK